MKAMVLRQFNQPLILEEVEVPKIGPGELLIRVKACGVCASDLKMVKGIVPDVDPPRILGHNISGEVADVGPGIGEFRAGERVCIHVFVTCGECFYCRAGEENNCIHCRRIGHELDGGYADYVKAPARNVVKIPDGVAFEEAAILSDAVCTSFHALRSKAKIKIGEDVAIMGVGGLGIHAVQIAKAAGARVIGIDIAPRKLEFAKKHGADETIDAQKEGLVERVRSITGGKGVDAIVDFVGSPESIHNGLQCLRRGGRLVIVGYTPQQKFEANPFRIMLEEAQIIGSHAQTRQDIRDVLHLVQAGRVKPIVAATYPLKEVNEVHRLLKTEDLMGRIVLIP
jgi:2-desacetyl-2-hydroxyethyl bacteriochlorophyllide A dehydrogenase